MTVRTALSLLFARLGAPTRRALALAVAVGFVARVAALVAALVAAASVRGLVVLGGASALLVVLERAALSRARILVEADLHRMTVSAVLEADVLAIREADLPLAVYDGALHAAGLIFAAAALVSEIAAATLVLPPALARLPASLLLGLAGALVLGGVVLGLVRSPLRRLDEAARAAFVDVAEGLARTVGIRLEAVAAGVEPLVRETDEVRLALWTGRATRAAWLGAVLGRLGLAPLVLLLALAAAGLGGGDGGLGGALLGALVIMALAGTMLALVRLRRGAIEATAFLGVLAEPRRDDAGAAGGRFDAGAFGLRAEALAFGYGADAPVFSGLDFALAPGQIAVVTGANGAGKSTLLRLLLGLRRPSAGELFYGDLPGATVDIQALRRATAYLPQRAYLGEAHETVAASFALLGGPPEPASIRDLLGRVGLSVSPTTPVGALSSGQRQRLALARMCGRAAARLLILDEPDANLDAAGVELVKTLIRGWAAEGKLVVLAAHDPALVTLADVVVPLVARPER